MPTQTELIGNHPITPNQFGRCFTYTDTTVTKTKCHRSLTAKTPEATDQAIIDWLARRIIHHHYNASRLSRLKEKYGQLGFAKYADQHRKLPRTDKTKKGNAAEIILIEYIESCQQKILVKAFKFRYNPNVDQSMKGDDLLMVDIKKKGKKEEVIIFLGEAKFRATPTKQVVDEIVDALNKDKYPISFSFLIDELERDSQTAALAQQLDTYLVEEIKGKGNLISTGLLWSNNQAGRIVESNLNSNNPKLIMLSAGNTDPQALIDKAYTQAELLLSKPTTI